MPQNPRQRRLKIALIFFSVILFANLIIAPRVLAVLPVAVTADATATAVAAKSWLSEAWTYIRNKMATILFQNLLRKYINELAMDAAKYLAIGAKGQDKLYIEKKWTNFWTNIGDQALGDFIETFANSVISDIAAEDIKKEGAAICERQKQECLDGGGTDCDTPYNECMANKGDQVSMTACDNTFSSCKTGCDKAKEETKQGCLDSCARVRDACKQSATSATEAARRAPMFKGSNSPLAKINICNPSLEVGLIITLGLNAQYTGYQNDLGGTCTFSQMKKNWTDEYKRLKDMASPDFLKKVSTQFYPNASDLSAALTLNSNLIEYRDKQVIDSKLTVTANKGYLDVRNFAGDMLGTPGEAEQRKKLADQALWDNLGKVTQDILVDAANIFLNQWAINSFNNLMGNLSANTQGSLSYWSGQATSRQAIENKLNKLKEPNFSAGGRIDILAQLSTCPSPDKPGPTDCVIGNEFSTAIDGRMTVIEAVRSGQLPGAWPFGVDKNGEDKIAYNQGYPYRSMIILRKYRIIPAGWEVATQIIQQQYLSPSASDVKTDFPNGVTLNDMLACYSPNDSVKGYNDNGAKEWCAGLVDPNWVLKVPEYFCARKGYGPELLADPTLNRTGVKYCSADDGETRTLVENRLSACDTNDDCCTDAELGARQKLIDAGKDQEARKYTCGASCTYNEQKLLVNRNDSYCADEQSCLKEGRNGSCLFYGYCTQEKRSWIFNKERKDESCDAIYNTCQSFKASNGKNVAYLANTLDYDCQQSAVGCKEYSYDGSYDVGTDSLLWDNTKNIYLNRKTATCSSKQEGCHEFIRVKDENGVNLLADGGLEGSDTNRWTTFGDVVKVSDTNKVYQGSYSLKMTPGKALFYSPDNTSLLPKGFTFDLDRFYTLSAYVYVVKGEVTMWMGDRANQASKQIINSNATGEWQNLVLTILNDPTTNTNSFNISGVTADTEFFIDNIKFEMGTTGKYSSYRGDNLLYEKLLPTYLEDACYRDKTKDFNFKDNAPAKCSEFVRKCQADEVGCELYTEYNTKDQTAAQVKPKDVCPKECVGYDTFIQKANNFYSARDEYFIPSTAKTCRSAAVGCALFVNLDKLNAGGEDNKYFSNFRRCVKPEEPNSNCAEFYTWEGSDESGYQLVVYQLQANTDTSSGISQPATVGDLDTTDIDDGADCNADIYALPYDHPQYNADCRQFYGRDGNVSYHIMGRTITCSKSCFPYRLVNSNVDVSVTDQAGCVAKQGNWNTDNDTCVICLNGGVWMEDQKACVYQADPAKSQTCSSAEVGCSEYEGDFGNQVRIIFNDTFESSGLNGWGPTTAISSDSLSVGGHSMQITTIGGNTSGWFSKQVKGKLRLGKRYVLSFTAKKKSNNAEINSIYLQRSNGSGFISMQFTPKVDLTPDWQKYTFDLQIKTQAELDSAEVLQISTNGQSTDIRIDNIKLIEMTDTHYLIRNSWKTPATCDQDLFGNVAPLYMLGCKQYSDRGNLTHYFKSFDKLCQDSAVGCELMIDTHNSSYWGAENFGSVTDPFTVPADNFSYIVYEKAKECRVADKGCSRLGQYDSLAEAHKDVYLLNNPDRYRDIMCTKEQVGCEAWGAEGGGEAYFKDPGIRVCEFRQGTGGGDFAWYKIKASHCVGTTACTGTADTSCGLGKYCAQISSTSFMCASKFSCEDNADCLAGTTCKLIDIDELCSQLDYNKTIGTGVLAEKVQPAGMTVKDASGKVIGNAGLCPANQVGCTEYIDPESSFSYDQLLRSAGSAKLKPNTLYILKKLGSTATISCTGGGLRNILENNTISNPAGSITTVKESEEFYIDGNINPGVVADNNLVDCPTVTAVAELREAIVSYKIKDSLSQDKPTTVNPGKGQVLFNERSFNGGKYNPLVWDVNNSSPLNGAERGPQVAINGNENNANALLKVDPDRQCATWLGCRSYMENPAKPGDKICYERGLCDQMNDAGECINFISPAPPSNAGLPWNQTWNVSSGNMSAWHYFDISNLTGYSKVGSQGNVLNADMYNLANMRQEGDAKVKFDGSFETAWETDFVNFKTGSTRASIISDAKVIEKELGFGSYRIIPDGRAVGKTNTFVVKEVNNAGSRIYIVSAYVFLKYGTKVELTVGRNLAEPNGACPFESINDNTNNPCGGGSYATVASTDVLGRWVRLVGKFSISNLYQRTGLNERDTRITIGIKPTNGLVYFDDVRLEPGLNYKDKGLPAVKQYLHSDCRLYPERESMSCDYYDDSGLRKKGWSGYCLEYDPRNPAVCLLWYPVDKVESEEYEEGVALNIPKDVYYCVDASDGCNDTNKVEPEFFCNKFIKVDKEIYWYDRITQGSGYEIPPNLLTNFPNATSSYFYADFGVNAGGRTNDIILNQKAGSGYYGAYSSLKPPRDDKLSVGNSAKKLLPFVPYFGWSYGGAKNPNNYCLATIDTNGHDKPWELSTPASVDCIDNDFIRATFIDSSGSPAKYDDCFIRIATAWDDDDTSGGKLNDICATWDYTGDNGNGWCTALNGDNNSATVWRNCKRGAFSCATETQWGQQRTNCLPPDYNALGTLCSVANLGDNTWQGTVSHTKSNNDDSGCFFDCFNHTNFYRVASDTRSTLESKKRAVQAVKRLFTGENKNQSCYEWNATAKIYEEKPAGTCDLGVPFNMTAYCESTNQGKNIRPDYVDDTLNRDYCMVRPTVPEVKLNDSLLKGSNYLVYQKGWVAISFSSTVDKEQLPLRKYVVNWGYQKQGVQVTLVRNVNMNARPSVKGGHQAYYFLDYQEIKSNNPNLCNNANCSAEIKLLKANADCCKITPSVSLTDNWQAVNSSTIINNTALGPLNHPSLDYPVIIWQ
jgi:hypothetical protein